MCPVIRSRFELSTFHSLFSFNNVKNINETIVNINHIFDYRELACVCVTATKTKSFL